MADYHSPLVIQPDIPLDGVTALELFLLTHMLQSEVNDDGVYLFAELSVEEMPAVKAGELRRAYSESAGVESRVLAPVGQWLDEAGYCGDDDGTHFDLDGHLEYSAWIVMLQDITRRSRAVAYFTVSGAYTCTKMRSDGFGGWAALIYPEDVRMQSTNDLLDTFINEAKFPPETWKDL